MSRYLIPLLLGMALNLLAHQYGLSQEPQAHFPVTGHTLTDMMPLVVPAPTVLAHLDPE